jgi:RNA-binding protein NOB1
MASSEDTSAVEGDYLLADEQSQPEAFLPAQTDAEPTPANTAKPIHSLILDTGPLIKNDPPISALLSQAETLYTLPSVLTEIRDEATRARVSTQLQPFITQRSPKPESVKFCEGFARKTGDLGVLSKTDLWLIALAYELEVERNKGDWRLRREPGQKGLNGKPPSKEEEQADAGESEKDAGKTTSQTLEMKQDDSQTSASQRNDGTIELAVNAGLEAALEHATLEAVRQEADKSSTPQESKGIAEAVEAIEAVEEEDSDSDGWITPSNLHKHQAKDAGLTTSTNTSNLPPKPLQVALLTSDYAMQNVVLRMNLNLVSPSLARITRLKTWVLRCHGCFAVTRDTSKQFCPKCGNPTLTRVSCSTNAADGSVQLHLKKNFQWNKRGNVYSIPKPVHGSASGKVGNVKGGGTGGWGQGLILAEDQKEFVRQKGEQRREKGVRDLMDPDYLPGLLGGDRREKENGRPKVGAGRNVNSKKRR